MPLAIASTNEEKVEVTADPRTASGQPAQIDGALTVEVLSGDATFTQDPASPLSFFAVSGSGAGTSQLRVSADADLGSGVTEISDVVDYEVSGAQAANFGLVAASPVPK